MMIGILFVLEDGAHLAWTSKSMSRHFLIDWFKRDASDRGWPGG